MSRTTKRIANTFALATAILWIGCSVFAWLLPDLYRQALDLMMHSMNVTTVGLTVSDFLLGGIAAVVTAWIAGFVFGWSWEFVGKRK